MPLLEFTVLGPPISYQTKSRANPRAWKRTIRREAAKQWKVAALKTKLKMILINFHEGDIAPLDDDNMVKPIRDALNKLVYKDDRQITYSEIIQVSIDAPIKIRRASKTLFDAYAAGDVFVYVRIEDAPNFIQLPQ
jgi:crossover junction endodeoxyribonuclease RusA